MNKNAEATNADPITPSAIEPADANPVLGVVMCLVEIVASLSASVVLAAASLTTDKLDELENVNRCGPLALKACAFLLGRTEASDAIDVHIPATGEQVSLEELRDCARSIGLQTLPVKWSTAVPEFGLESPAIIPLKMRGGQSHYVVLLRHISGNAQLLDVPQKPVWVELSGLRRDFGWEGYALHIANSESSLQQLQSEMSWFRSSSSYWCIGIGLTMAIAAVFPGLKVNRRWLSKVDKRELRHGFTIMELIVVVGVIGLLLALLLPAIQQVRESSRKTRCINNLRQIGIAVAAHESMLGIFPVAKMGNIDEAGLSPMFLAPHVALLSFLDQEALYQKIDKNEDALGAADDPPSSTRNQEYLSLSLPVYMCPSDGVSAGGNSYRVSLGTSPQMHTTIPETDENGAKAGALSGQSRGVAAKKIVDGLSQTVFFSERCVGDRDTSRYRPWQDVFIVTPGPAQGFKYPDDALLGCRLPTGNRPDHISFGGATWLIAGYDFTWYNHITTPNSTLTDCTLGRGPTGSASGSFAARSDHRGGANVLFGDGVARLISESVDLKVWRSLGTRDGHENISSGGF